MVEGATDQPFAIEVRDELGPVLELSAADPALFKRRAMAQNIGISGAQLA